MFRFLVSEDWFWYGGVIISYYESSNAESLDRKVLTIYRPGRFGGKSCISILVLGIHGIWKLVRRKASDINKNRINIGAVFTLLYTHFHIRTRALARPAIALALINSSAERQELTHSPRKVIIPRGLPGRRWPNLIFTQDLTIIRHNKLSIIAFR